MNQNWFTGQGQAGGGGGGGGGGFGQQPLQQSWGNQQPQGWIQGGGQWAGQPHPQQTGFYGNQQQFQQFQSSGQFVSPAPVVQPPPHGLPHGPPQQSHFLSQQAYAQEHERRVREEKKKKEMEEQKKKLQSVGVGRKPINIDDLFERQMPDMTSTKPAPPPHQPPPPPQPQPSSKPVEKEKQSGKARSWVSEDFTGLFSQHHTQPPPQPLNEEGDFGDFQSSDQTSNNVPMFPPPPHPVPGVTPTTGHMISTGNNMIQSGSHMISTSSYQEPLSSVNVQQGYQGSQPPLSPKKQSLLTTNSNTHFPQQINPHIFPDPSTAGSFVTQQGTNMVPQQWSNIGPPVPSVPSAVAPPPPPPTQGGAMDPSSFHPLYHKVYRLCRRTGDELVSTDLLYPVLVSSNLSRSQLRDLWARANRGRPGQLSQLELFILLGLVGLAQGGNEDPSVEDLKKAPNIPVPTLPGLSVLSPSSSSSSPSSSAFSAFFPPTSSVQQPPSVNDRSNQFQMSLTQQSSLQPSPLAPQTESPSSSHSILQPSMTAARSLSPVELHDIKPLTDHSGIKPLADHSGIKPLTDHSGTKPLADHSGIKLLTDHSGTKPLADHSGIKPLADHSGTKPNQQQQPSINDTEFGDFSIPSHAPPPSQQFPPIMTPQLQPEPAERLADDPLTTTGGDDDGWADFSSAPLAPGPSLPQPVTAQCEDELSTNQLTAELTFPPPLFTSSKFSNFQLSGSEAPTIDGMEKDLLSKLTSSVTAGSKPVEKKEEKIVKPPLAKIKKQEVEREEEAWLKCLEKCGDILKSCIEVLETVEEKEVLLEIAESEQSLTKLHSIAEVYRFAKRMYATLSTRHPGNAATAGGEEVKKNWKQLKCLLPNNKMDEIYNSSSSSSTSSTSTSETDVLSDTISHCSICQMGKTVSLPSSLSLDTHPEYYSLPLIFHQGQTFHAPCANFWRHLVSRDIPSYNIISN